MRGWRTKVGSMRYKFSKIFRSLAEIWILVFTGLSKPEGCRSVAAPQEESCKIACAKAACGDAVAVQADMFGKVAKAQRVCCLAEVRDKGVEEVVQRSLGIWLSLAR